MARGTFGERLKRERELREVTLEEVAKSTRISERFLRALENEDWNKLPGGLFGRAFVRTTARYLGLDEENLLGEYDLARGESMAPAPSRPEERIPSPPRWIPLVFVLGALILLLVLALGALYAWRSHNAHRNSNHASSFASPTRGPGVGEGVAGIAPRLDATPRAAYFVRYNSDRPEKFEAGSLWRHSARKSLRICAMEERRASASSRSVPGARTSLRRTGPRFSRC